MRELPKSRPPRRIICLSTETREILVRLGARDRVVEAGIGPAGFQEEPQGEGGDLSRAELDGLLRLTPEVVLASFELRGEAARELARRDIPVMAFPPERVREVLGKIRLLGKRLELEERGNALAADLESEFEKTREKGEMLLRRPRVFFEEWPEPLVSCSAWVSDLLEAAGGEDVFPELREDSAGRERTVDPVEVARREPEVIIASWRGERVDFDRVRSRPGWDRLPAVRREKVYAIDPALILRPGPVSFTRGLARLHEILAEVSLG